MLARVRFTGIKSLLDVAVDLERFTVLVGPNGCGKSTLLDQVEVLCRASEPEPGLRHALGSAGFLLDALGLPSLRTHGVPGGMSWEGRDDEQRSLSVRVDDPAGTHWWRTASVRARIGEREGLTPTTTPDDRSPQRGAEPLLAEAGWWRAQRLRLTPDAIARPCAVSLSGLLPDGTGLATVLKDLAANDTPAYEAVQEDLRAVVPQFRRLRLEKAKDTAGVDQNALLLEMRGGGRLPAARVSDGTLVALALLTATHDRDLPGLLLMDDIDHGLHLGAQYQIVRAIRKVMEVRPELQVLCTTHSPVLLDSFDVAEVRVMALDPEGHTVVRPLAEHPEVDRYRELLQTGELWASMGEEWVTDARAGA